MPIVLISEQSPQNGHRRRAGAPVAGLSALTSSWDQPRRGRVVLKIYLYFQILRATLGQKTLLEPTWSGRELQNGCDSRRHPFERSAFELPHIAGEDSKGNKLSEANQGDADDLPTHS